MGRRANCFSMCRAIHLLFIAILLPAIRAFGVSWLNAPNEIEHEFAKVPHYRYERPPPAPWPSMYRTSSGSIMIEEDNQVCARFRCERKPCCAGQCVFAFHEQICILLPRYPAYGAYGRRR